ncbi:baeRF3 domain-containing protein [Actinomadura monticuli]|uniref:Chemotaxis protein n=1 Tax=Actinomadura monticuli TaxID=3097367 RepID=A0ABV4Q7M5_9ACTN
MDAVTLSELRKPRAYPAVSVLMPTHRSVPDNRQDPIRLRNLLAEVRRRLHDDDRVAHDAADHVLRGLESAAEEIDLRHASDGLVLFAAPDGEHHAFTIDQPVDERVVVDTGFATRDLVAAYTRTPRYWLLSLSDQRTRLWDGRGEELTERTGGGFPVVPEPLDEAGSGRQARRAAQGGDGERQRRQMRDAVAALDRVLARDRRPLIVAGVIRHQAFFDEVAGPHITVAGRVDGSFEGAAASVLAEAARPALAAYEDLREVGVLAELEAARSIQRYAGGLCEVTPLVEEGRGEHLVVERGYYAPAVKARGELVPVDGMPGVLKGADVVDDAVDDVIETVLEYGGEVTFVSDGFLVDHGRIALVTRY